MEDASSILPALTPTGVSSRPFWRRGCRDFRRPESCLDHRRIRLCKAKRYRYKNNDMDDLETQLKEADREGAKMKLIATDGVFSMDGIVANLKGVCDLAENTRPWS